VSPGAKRILIVSASIGGGHVAAGRALQQALGEAGIESEHVDLLEYTAVPFRRLYRQAYFELVRTAPDLVEWLGRRMDRTPREEKTRQQRLRARLSRLLSYELPRRIAEAQPDVIVHTHFLGPEILSGRLRRAPATPQVEVITDFFAHSLWLQPGLLRYFRVTGIPIDLRFAALPGRAEARAQLELPPERDLLLLVAAGLQSAVLRDLLRQLQALRWPLGTVVVCGRSPDLVAVAQDAVDGYAGPGTFAVHGQRDDMPLLMAAADMLAGKPGGLISSEALAAGLPIAVITPYPIQEEANANALLERGAAMRIAPLSIFEHKLAGFLADPERRETMSRAARTMGRPDAARAVVDTIRRELLGGASPAGA